MEATKKPNIVYRALRRIWRIFFPVPTHEELVRRARQKDYEFLVSQGVETQPGYVTLYGQPIIHKHPDARIVLGKGVTIISDSIYNYAGINHPAILAATQPGAEIILHDGVGISGTSIVAEKRVEIGEHTMLGANTNVYDTDFHPINANDRIRGGGVSFAPVRIGKQCWIAANSTILKGVNIGDQAVIGAMSLVNRDIPENVFAAGIPAKVIKELKRE